MPIRSEVDAYFKEHQMHNKFITRVTSGYFPIPVNYSRSGAPKIMMSDLLRIYLGCCFNRNATHFPNKLDLILDRLEDTTDAQENMLYEFLEKYQKVQGTIKDNPKVYRLATLTVLFRIFVDNYRKKEMYWKIIPEIDFEMFTEMNTTPKYEKFICKTILGEMNKKQYEIKTNAPDDFILRTKRDWGWMK